MSVICCNNKKSSCRRLGHIHVSVLKNMDELVLHLVKLVVALLLLLHHAAHPVAAAAHGHKTAVLESQPALPAGIRFLVSAAASSPASPASASSPPAAPVSTCLYTVITETGNKLGAGTDAKVSVKFYNKSGDAVTFQDLENGEDDNFERGSTDTFEALEGPCVSGICRMWLTHDNTGIFPAWYVQSVKVSQGRAMKTFRVMQWVSRHNSDDFASLLMSECDYFSP